jgi:hypothetical protein
MTLSINNRSFVGIASLVLERQSDGVLLNWPVPQTFVLNTNIEQRIQETRSNQGRKVRAGSYVAGEMPELTISYSYIQPEMIGFTVGNQMAAGSFSTFIPKRLEVTKAAYSGAAAGELFNGIAADVAGSKASVTRDGLSASLTRVTYDTFVGTSPENDDTWALGADGALKFSANLVSAREVVTLLVPVSATGNGLSNILVGAHKLYATLINTLNKVTLFEAPSVTPNLEGRSVDFGGEGLEVQLFLNNAPGECRSWKIIDTEYTVSCI